LYPKTPKGKTMKTSLFSNRAFALLAPLFSMACVSTMPYDPSLYEKDDVELGDSGLSMKEGESELESEPQGSSGEGFSEEETTSSEPEESNDTCTYSSFDVVGSRAFVQNSGTEQPLFVFQAANTDAFPMDVMEVLSFSGAPYYGPSSPGSYSIEGNNYEDCSLCLLIYAGCGETSCEAYFFADAGTVMVNSNMDVGQPFSAVLSDVVFREVTIDPETYRSTPVSGGQTWCVNSLELSAVPTAE
jgi:hypothetical protein